MSVTFGGRNSSHHVDLSSLRLTGQSAMPVHADKHDHNNPHRQEEAGARTLDKKAFPDQRVYVRKERQGFGGGFKILEEYRRNKMKKKGDQKRAEHEDEDEHKDQNQVTKDEIFQLLNLGNAEGGIGAGKYGNTSKKALTNDLIEGLEKDLERLKRFEENLRIRKLRTMKGGDKIINETDDDRYKAKIAHLHQDVEGRGAHIIHADLERLQLMRHKAGQLDSLKNLDIRQLEEQRLATQKQIDELTEVFLYQKEQQAGPGVAKAMRRKMGKSVTNRSPRSQGLTGQQRADQMSDYSDLIEDDEARPMRSRSRKGGKKSKSIRFGDDDGEFEREDKDTPPTRSRSRPGRSRVAFDEPKVQFGQPLKSALAGGDKHSSTPALKLHQTEKSRGSSRSRSMGAGLKNRSQSGGRHFEEPKYGIGGQGTDHRRDAFEAKFDKYRANRKTKDAIEKRAKIMEQPDFDVTTKNRKSPSKKARKYTTVVGAEIDFKPSGKFETEALMPEGYEELLMREELMDTRKDPFKVLGVSPEDKMTFFLLKWVFDYIKQDSEVEDEHLAGKAYVTKKDLVSQLSKNPELMNALDIKSRRQLNDQVENAASAKKGCLTWEEFLNYFFLRNATFEDRIDGNDWWTKLDQNGAPVIEEIPVDKTVSGVFDDDLLDDKENEGENRDKYSKMSRGARLLKEFKPVSMTPALEFLMNTRKEKVKFDVEEDFRNMQETQGTKATSGPMDMMKSGGGRGTKASGLSGTIVDQDAVDAQLGISREKSKMLLLPSQIETMKQEYELLDKYQDGIQKRGEFIKHLRMDMKVVDFIDAEAVRVAGQKNKILTLDQVLYEIEQDENYEMMQLSKQEDAINHKEFITWSEFLSYFQDYKEIEERNKKAKTFQATRETLNKNNNQQEDIIDEKEEYKTLLEGEKERRLQELPKLRPQDMIDISEDQIQLIKGIYDSQQKIGTAVNTVTFFMALRKNKDVRKILSAVARDPEGHSRLPTETFQQVFDRMEKDMQVKTIEWPTVIEYFTKLGRPLSKDEIKRLQDEDKRMREEEEENKRREEEAERRRMARLMEEINDDNAAENASKPKKRPNFRLEDSEEGDMSERDDDRVFQGFDDSDEFDSDEDSNDLERESDNRRYGRNQSARHLRGNNLNEKRITSDDYMHQVREKSLRKGRYGVTVPKPFSFEMRDNQAKKANTRERKVNEMVMEKKMEEENMVKHQFRHKPIPAAVLIPRYQQIQDKNEERRLKVKQQSIEITKQREAPFSFWERDKAKMARKNDPEAGLVGDCKRPAFRANPMPDFSSIPIYDEQLRQQEEARLKRIHQAAEESYAAAKMPSRMQQALEDEKRKPKARPEAEFSFKPMINEPKTGEQFKKLQNKFQAQLNKTKSEKRVTEPQPFKLNETKSKPLERSYVNEGPPGAAKVISQAAGGDKLKETLMAKQSAGAKSRSSGTGAPVKQPSSTRAATLLQQRRREELEAQKALKERKEKEDADRKARQNQLKGTVQGMLKGSLQNAQAAVDKQVAEKKAQARKLEREAKQKNAELQQRARTRPFLVDSYNTGTYRANNLAKAQTLKKFVDVMKNSGISERDIQNNHLSLADKEVLEEDKFVEAQKKMYGKTSKDERDQFY